MKKVLLSLVFSVLLMLGAAPALMAEASEEKTESFQTDAQMPVYGLTSEEAQVMPAAEYNTDFMTIGNNLVTIGEVTVAFMEYDPNGYEGGILTYVFDETGELLTWGTVSSMGETKVYRYMLSAFSGSKQLMFVLYHEDEDSRGYQLMSAKKVTVTPVVWKGSASNPKLNAYQTSTSCYQNVYLPKEISTEGLEVKLYDGETQIGYMQIGNKYSSTNLLLDSLVNNIKSQAYLYYSAVTYTQVTGTLYWGVQPEAGKAYSFKAFAGDQVYDLGAVICSEDPYITLHYSDALSTDKPMVYLLVHGYDINDVTVQIRSKTDDSVLAVSNNSPYSCFRYSDKSAYLLLDSDKSIEELDGEKLVALYDGEVIYTDSFYVGTKITAAYYDHVNDVVAVNSYGIPDGTVIKATISEDYEATGTVMNNSAILAFTKDGAATKLPVGSQRIIFKYTVGEAEETYYYYNVKVMGKGEEAEGAFDFIRNNYHYSGNEIGFDIVIGKKRAENLSGDFKVTYVAEGVTNECELSVEDYIYDDMACYKLHCTMPSMEAKTYPLQLYCGETKISSYNLYVMESCKVYATMSHVSDGNGHKGVRMNFTYKPDEWDLELVTLKLTDIAGNEVQMDYSKSVSSKSVSFYLDKVPENMLYIKAEPMYNGQPIYDISNIGGAPLISVRDFRKSDYLLYALSMTNAQNYSMMKAFRVLKPSVAYVVESGTAQILKTWEFPVAGEYVYLTQEMLSGLSYNDARVSYDIFFLSSDGKSADLWNRLYLGYSQQVVVQDGIGTDANGNYWLYSGGEINYSYTGLYYWAQMDKWCMIVEGLLDFSYTGLTYYNNIWWYVQKGYVAFNYTGLAELNGTMWYVRGGQIDFTYNGLLCIADVWYYMEGGRVNTGYSGLAFVNDNWWYVVNGVIDFGYTGLVYFNNAWWYVNQGRIDFEYSGLFFYNNEWWYLQRGNIDFSYVGLTYFNDSWWYIQDGKINFSYTGLVFVNDAWWYVQGGIIDFNYNGMAFYDNKWWYVSGARIDFNYTGLCFFNNEWYYIANGEWAPAYNGTTVGPDGNTYNVVDGKVVF